MLSPRPALFLGVEHQPRLAPFDPDQRGAGAVAAAVHAEYPGRSLREPVAQLGQGAAGAMLRHVAEAAPGGVHDLTKPVPARRASSHSLPPPSVRTEPPGSSVPVRPPRAGPIYWPGGA